MRYDENALTPGVYVDDLPNSVREIAEVLGREKTLYMIGKLPRAKSKDHPSGMPILYVPKSLKLDHELVKLLGWEDANKLVKAFGGEILQPAPCTSIIKAFRHKVIRDMAKRGMKQKLIAVQADVSTSMVAKILRGKSQEESAVA